MFSPAQAIESLFPDLSPKSMGQSSADLPVAFVFNAMVRKVPFVVHPEGLFNLSLAIFPISGIVLRHLIHLR